MEDSIFAKIVSGEVPCHKIYEDDEVLAFLDVFPKTEGHTLVIPKVRPTEFIWDLDDEIYQKCMRVSHRIGQHLRDALQAPYVHLGVVGNEVPYTHIHLIPFTDASELWGATEKADDDTLAAVAERLRLT
jgi:histidine triad (HIT) family protein